MLSIPNGGSPTVVPFPTKEEDTDSIANVGIDTFTIKRAGIWHIASILTYAPNATGARYVHLNRNVAYPRIGYTAGVATYDAHAAISVLIRLAANDTIKIGALQTSGAALNITAASLGMIWLRP